MPSQAKHLPVLRPRRNLESQRSTAESLNLRLTAKHHRRQGHADLGVEVAPLAFEPRMRSQLDSKIEIAAASGTRSALAFATDADPRAFRHAGRNTDFDVSQLAVVANPQALHAAVQRAFQVQLELVLDVSTLPIARRSRPCSPALRRLATTKERAEEIGERTVVLTEHVRHFFFGHRAEAATTR